MIRWVAAMIVRVMLAASVAAFAASLVLLCFQLVGPWLFVFVLIAMWRAMR